MKTKEAKKIFNEQYDAFYNEIYSYIFAKTGDVHSTPEILNDSFLNFYKHVLSLEKDNIVNKRAYLYSIVQKNLAKYYKAKASPAVSLDAPETGADYDRLIAGELSEHIISPENSAQVSDLIQRILAYVAERPLLQRRAFILRFMFDMPVAKIAEELSLSSACTGNYIYRLLKDVRKEFQSEYIQQ